MEYKVIIQVNNLELIKFFLTFCKKTNIMKKTYQPFILEKADEILYILKDDIEPTEQTKNHLCDILTEKFIKGELSSEDPIDSIFDEEELLLFINESLIRKDLDSLIEQGLINVLNDDNNEEMFFLTEKGKKYVENNLLGGEK